MEGVPRLTMLSVALKTSPGGTYFVNLKKYIAECYQENPESYSKEVYDLEMLRNAAMHPAKDVSGCATLKRYYCQLHSLANRFPSAFERNLFVFNWKDLYSSNVEQVTDIRHEMAAVLYNIGALHTQQGASVSRVDADGMKLACTHFQCAAWAFGELKDKYKGINNNTDFMNPKLLLFLQQLSFAQAQECILEKSLIDNRKSAIVAKVTAQIVSYYSSALAALLTTGDDNSASDAVDNNALKEWKKYVKFKISYMYCILYLYQGQQAEEQQKMGERVALFQAAWDKLEEARKESKGMAEQKQITESLIFTADVVEAKRKTAKNENEFIYHEAVPELSDIQAIQGANLVNGTGFSVTDPETAGEDIFARLIPMKAHEASSLYSEEKAQLLRNMGTKIEDKDNELVTFMSSLNIDHLSVNEDRNTKIPQGIVDRCASLNAKTNAIPDLIASMSNLAEICADVETSLKEIKELLNEEDLNEKRYQQKLGVHRSNVHITELSREYQKYLEAHQKAGESNDTLRRAMELHVNNLRILAKPLQEIQSSVPKLSGEVNDSVFQELKLLLNKVNEMKAQRAQFHADLRISVSNDDVTSKIIAYGSDKDLKDLFKEEIAKHDKICTLIDKNLSAQANILSALTEAYAKCAPALKTMVDVKHKKDNFFTSLAASYDVYEDLLAKSAKGLEFYKKLQGNVQKLLSRVRAARDVQDEERQQRLNSIKEIKSNSDRDLSKERTTSKSNQPKLKDFLKSGKNLSNIDSTYIPPIRPNPLGSETPSTSTCVPSSSTYYSQQQIQQSMEPPPPYTSLPQPYYDTSGYTNPIYQNNQIYDATAKADGSYSMYQNQPQSYQNPAFTHQQTYPNYPSPQLSQTNIQTSQSPAGMQNFQTDQNAYASQYSAQTYDSQGNLLNKSQNMMQSYQYSPNPTTYVPQSYDNQTAYQNQSVPHQDSTAYQIQKPVQPTVPSSSSNDLPLQSNMSWGTTGITKQMENMSLQSNMGATIYNPYQQQYDAHTVQLYGQQVNAPEVIPSSSQSATSLSATMFNRQNSYSSHPGYVFNSATGEYQYASGYQADSNVTQQGMYTHHTNAVSNQISNTTDSSNLSIAGQSFANQYSTDTQKPDQSSDASQAYSATNYYTIPYGYQSSTVGDTNSNSTPVISGAQNFAPYTNGGQSMTYMHSNSSNVTQTTISGGYDPTTMLATNDPSSVIYQTQQQLPPTGQYNQQIQYQVQPEQLTAEQFQQIQQSQQMQPQYQQVSSTIPSQLQQTPQSIDHIPSLAPSSQFQQIQATTPTTPQLQQNIEQFQPIQHHTSQTQQNVQPVEQYSQQTQQNQINIPTNEQYTQQETQHIQSNTVPMQQFYQQQTQPILQNPVQQNLQTQKATQKTPAKSVEVKKEKQSSNIDLLSGIDFSSSTTMLPTPPLQPQVASLPKSESIVSMKDQTEIQNPVVMTTEKELPPLKAIEKPIETNTIEIDTKFTPNDRKSSCDNISICSDLSSLDQNFDWDSISVRNENIHQQSSYGQDTTAPTKFKDPFDDAKVLKYFHKEVESYEKTIETLNIKMLNGNTPLVNKWKDLQDLLVKDEAKRTTSIAKLFPEKNRTPDCIPYDHARVVLERNTDDYINAAYIKDLGSKCPTFIIAQTPLANTVNDFWSMVWSQKSRTIVCLHTPNEILDTFWPQEINKEMHFDDFTVTLIKQFDLSHCIELNLKVTLTGADAILDLSLLQIKSWIKNSPAHILGIAQNILVAYKLHSQEFKSTAPLIMNCLTGSERSGLVALALCTITATETRRPILINVVDVWYRICSQRKAALRDTNNLQLSMQIVLSHAHNVLNKRGIMTSYQMKNAQTVTATEKEEVKDPLMDLDPLWKLKQK